MKKFFQKMLCCTTTAHIEVSAIAPPINMLENSETGRQFNEIEIEKKEPAKGKIARIDSLYASNTLQCSNFRPNGGEQLRYNCPICFRFFDKMLITSCCKNYICHFCIDELNQKVTGTEKVYNTRCPFCSSEDISLRDVDPNEKPKRYTDSPCVSIKSRVRTSSQLSDQLTGKLKNRARGRLELFQVDDIVTAGFANNRRDISKFGSEGAIDSEEDDSEENRARRCVTEPAAINNTLTSQDIEAALRRARNASLHENHAVQVLRFSKNRFSVEEDFVIPEAPIGMEATPHLPNNNFYKKSYEGVSNV